MKNNASLVYGFFLVVGDTAAIILSFVAAFIIRASSGPDVANPVQGGTFALMVGSLLPLWILIFALLGLYNYTIYERRFAEAGRLLVGSFVGVLMMIAWDYMSLQAIFPAKLVPVYGLGLAFILLVCFRNLTRVVRTMMFAYGIGLTRMVIIGNTPVTEEIVKSLDNPRRTGYEVIGVVGYRKSLPDHVASYPNFASFLVAEPQDLHGIMQTELYSNEARNAEILTYAQEHHVSYRFVPGNSELFVGNLDVDLFRNAIPVIHIHHTALFGWGRVLKRLTDIGLGGVLLGASLPLWFIVGLLIKLTDPRGPIFYRAERMSRFGNKVKVLKFRTMKQAFNAMTPEAGFAKMGRPELAKQYRLAGDQLKDDPRVSRIGKFLRTTSLDELPQLWNVMRGEISLVGPRALDIVDIERSDKKNLILSVKSGLTGLAVVSGRRDISFEERRKLDLYYVQNWSFWLDIVILLKTIRVVLSRIGAK
ncbi:sugar transferase [Candidatus Saccharibacteria bacterium]|nr:sugar transferase [Candidatus Saccharibacteria bacterium]